MTARLALVTGANGGIGAAVCDRLRADGVNVRTMDVTGECDVMLDLATESIPAAAVADVDICVSVAGIVDTVAPAHKMSAPQWARDIDVNLTGAFRVVQACLPGMRGRRYGRIVAISSMAARIGAPGQVAYAASKAGLQGMMRTVATENAAYGITANSILPGLIATPKVLSMPASIRDRLLDAIPSNRLGTPEEVAELVAFMTRDGAGYITAQEIGIDGGLGLHTLTLAKDPAVSGATKGISKKASA